MADFRNPRLRVAMIACDFDGRVLLLQHVRKHGEYWVLPGGGVDIGESLESAVVREVREELGVGSVVERLVAIGELILPKRHVVDFFYTGRLDRNSGFAIRYEEGIGDAGWFSRDEIRKMAVLPPEIKSVPGFPDRLPDGIAYLGKYSTDA